LLSAFYSSSNTAYYNEDSSLLGYVAEKNGKQLSLLPWDYWTTLNEETANASEPL
jgi:hypothetical protein